ncbi:helix-turn-helix transcriptional regulator [Mucilaginibacter sp. OK098]|uniref:helix-turn-helix transcriptional regulator n=1 Tax=Mucilaginibacter sp. OK098 TaxID=1855297 RepID=UPI00091AB198|nr:helix-turn-helix transcriptional regulator [Mucilaginibacter sp. OK098]SHM45740.1 Helix-turn-helix domain-containing protein [Mucilaginibacter sp. OK098]
MTVNTYIPANVLKPFIKNYLVIESNYGDVNQVLPDTSLVLAFRYKGNVNYITEGIETVAPVSVLSGLRKSSRLISYSAGAATILVIFKPAAASTFFKVPLHELFEDSVPLYNFISSQKLAEIEDQLSAAKNNFERINLIDQFLSAQIISTGGDKLVLAAIEKLHAAKGFYKIKDLANSLYISQDAFEKKFRKTTGASPKHFSSVIRLRNIVSAGKQQQNFTELAYDAGYFDQSHFNKDFRLFTGQTPSDFFKSPSFW